MSVSVTESVCVDTGAYGPRAHPTHAACVSKEWPRVWRSKAPPVHLNRSIVLMKLYDALTT